MSEINKLTVWRTIMKEIIQEYPQKTGESILQQVNARIKNLEENDNTSTKGI